MQVLKSLFLVAKFKIRIVFDKDIRDSCGNFYESFEYVSLHEDGKWYEVDSYHYNPRAAEKVDEKMFQRGSMDDYLWLLCYETGSRDLQMRYELDRITPDEIYRLIRHSKPEQKCRAALKTIVRET